MAIIKNIYGNIARQDDLPTVRDTLLAWVAEFRAKGKIPDLSNSDLRGSNLRGSNLSNSNLSNSDLRGSNLRGSDLHFLGNCSRGYGFYLLFEPEAVIRAGCRKFTIDQAIEHWSNCHSDDPILRAEILGKIECAKMIIAAREAAKTEEAK